MFTGIVERSLRIVSVSEGTGFRRINLAVPWPDVKHGESIAINGVCLTVAELDATAADRLISFDVIPETLAKTNLGMLKGGDPVHVERALVVGERVSGHFLQGHIDAQARLISATSADNDIRLKISPPQNLMKYIVAKGSVAIDGVSLTVASVQAGTFEVALIPTTLQLTHLGVVPIGYPFNLETDILSKTVVGYLEAMKLGS